MEKRLFNCEVSSLSLMIFRTVRVKSPFHSISTLVIAVLILMAWFRENQKKIVKFDVILKCFSIKSNYKALMNSATGPIPVIDGIRCVSNQQDRSEPSA